VDTGEKQPAATLRLTQVQQLERRENSWMMQGKVAGAAEAVVLELTVLTPEIIRLSVQASNLGEKAGLGFDFTGPGPFFGLGERFAKAKLDGLKTIERPEDNFGQPGHNWTYLPVPLLFTPHGLGLYLDTAWVSTFDLSGAAQERFSAQLLGPSTDCYFFVGQPKEILGAYTSLTGRPPVPPPWAFGVWVDCRKGRGPVFNAAHRLRQVGIPASAIWVHDFMDHASNLGFPLYPYGGFWDTKPSRFTDDLHKLGYKVLAYRSSYVRSILAPYLLPNPTFEEGLRNHFFVVKPDGQPVGPTFEPVPTATIDFTNPAAVDWWERMLQRSLVDDDFDGWMEDFGENVEDDYRFAVGKDGRQMANLYPLLYHMLTYKIARRYKPDFVSFARSGSAGSQGHTCVVWGGDQLPDWSLDNGFPSLIPAGITAGLSGYATWGPDIQSRTTSKELWIRWAQFGALTPIMRDHVWDMPKFSVDLWFDSETIDTFRRYARLHVSLFPYFYTYAHQAATTGLPIMRHLLLEWPDDPEAWNAEHQYLLGEKILVAPVIAEGARTRSLYLPKGSWVDYWTGEIVEGGRHVEVSAPLEHIPILVRAGSVIPLIDPETETLAQDLAAGKYHTLGDSLTWRVFPASGAAHDSCSLYDGTTVTVEQEASGIQVRAEGSSVTRQYEVVLPDGKAPREVTLSGQHLDKLDNAGYRLRKKGWWVNSDERTLHVLFVTDNFVVKVSGR
jgi:alpha-D-xyloside xylohydrolase